MGSSAVLMSAMMSVQADKSASRRGERANNPVPAAHEMGRSPNVPSRCCLSALACLASIKR